MLQHWLQPHTSAQYNKADFQPHQYGALLQSVDQQAPNWTVGSLALMGWGAPSAYVAARDAFAQLTHRHAQLQLFELGLVQPDVLPLTELLDYLLQQGVFPIVLSQDARAIEAQLRAQEQRQDLLDLALVDAVVPYRKGPFSSGILQQVWAHPNLVDHTICLGSQAYLLDPVAIAALQERQGECHRLGGLRQQISAVEPLVRQADVAAFGLSAIRAADAPGQSYPNPNGWTAEEACQIARYMGMSDQLSTLCFYGLEHASPLEEQTAALLGQLIWFAIEGHQARLHEWPLDRKALLAYVVDHKDLDLTLTFYKSPKSDRWWFEIPPTLSKTAPLVACSYRDYQLACEGELVDRLLLAIHRLA